ncbi:MAG: uridine kinase [Candidatus Sumerlaeia bacterium]|nr:uridine kinase [Candidatus Sumerlaeia bacterium]
MASHCLIVGIAGGSGSGKTTVARNLVERLGGTAQVPIVGQDSYYLDLGHLPFEERKKMNFDHPDSFDNDLLLRHLGELREGRAIECPLYNYATYTRREGTIRIEPSRIVILEGILIFTDRRLRDLMDIKVFVDIDPDIRFIRRLNRDVRERGRSLESVVDQYTEVVRPMHMKFVEPSKRHADIIIPVGGQNTIAIDMVAAKLRDILSGKKS